MSNTSRDSAVAVQTKLEEFWRKWESVKIAREKESVAGLKTSTKKGVRTAKQVIVKTGNYESYLATRDRAMSIAARMFIDDFAPLASMITETIGLSRFSDVPQEPPCPVQVLGHGRAALALTGTHVTSESGRRILAWGAMAHSPADWHRAENFYIAVAKWAESLNYDSSPGKAWQLMHKPIRWVVDFVGDALQSISTNKKVRPAYGRDHYFLKRKRGGATPSQIRSDWNEMTEDQRRAICPGLPRKVKDGRKGTETVKTGIKNAKSEERNG